MFVDEIGHFRRRVGELGLFGSHVDTERLGLVVKSGALMVESVALTVEAVVRELQLSDGIVKLSVFVPKPLSLASSDGVFFVDPPIPRRIASD